MSVELGHILRHSFIYIFYYSKRNINHKFADLEQLKFMVNDSFILM